MTTSTQTNERYQISALEQFDDLEFAFTIRDTHLPNDAAHRYQLAGSFATTYTQDARNGQMARYYPDADARRLLGKDCPTGLTARKTKNALRRLLAER